MKGVTFMKIYISPSDQKSNVGVGNYGTEADRMQQLSNYVAAALKEMGHTVYGGNNSLNLDQRIAASNNARVDCHVALHSNAGGGTGTEVWYYQSSTNGKRLATNLLNNVTAVSGCPGSRGIKATTTLKEVRGTTAPCALIEVAFHDRQTDVNWIIGNMAKIGKAIANAINAF